MNKFAIALVTLPLVAFSGAAVAGDAAAGAGFRGDQGPAAGYERGSKAFGNAVGVALDRVAADLMVR